LTLHPTIVAIGKNVFIHVMTYDNGAIMEKISQKDIEKVYYYLVENKNKMGEREFTKLKDFLKNSLIKLYSEKIISKNFFEIYFQKIKLLEKEEIKKNENILFERCPLCGRKTGGCVIKTEKEKNILVTQIREVRYLCTSCDSVWKKERGKKELYRLIKANCPTMYKGETLSIQDWRSIAKTGFSRYHLLLKELAEGNFRRLKKLNKNEISIMLKRGEKALLSEKKCILYEPREKFEYQEEPIQLLKDIKFLLGQSTGSFKSRVEIEKVDEGSLILTNQRLVLLGKKENTTIWGDQILKVEISKDSVTAHLGYGTPQSFSVGNPEILGNALIGVVKIALKEESKIKLPEEKEGDLEDLEKIKKIIEFYNKKSYKLIGYNFKYPFLKVTISKNDKSYLAIINIETNKVEYKPTQEE